MFFILDSQCGNSNLYVQGFQLSKHSSPSMIFFLCLFLNPVLFLGVKFQLTGTGVSSVGNPLSFFSGGPAFASSIEKIDEIEFQQLNLIQKSKHQQEKHQASETEHNVRQKSQGRLHKGIDSLKEFIKRDT